MKNVDQMTINEAFEIYYKKQTAIKEGNFLELINLKKICPDLFNKKTEEKLSFMIRYLDAFKRSETYQDLCRLEVRSRLRLVK